MPTPEQLARMVAVVPFAQAAMRKWHVPASITLAQWTFESGWGQDAIAVQANNCFGIKHLQSNRREAYVEFRTPEYWKGAKEPHYILADFVKYDSVADSFDAHGKLIATNARYLPAMAVAGDVHAFARQLQLCGYSTSPKYGKSLCDQIDSLNLTQYDHQPPPTASAEKQAA